jgi:hypothetical protein
VVLVAVGDATTRETGQTGLTFEACGPFVPCVTSNSTA